MKPLVYVLEDDVRVRENMAALLQGHGYDVISFSSPEGFLNTYAPYRGPACLIVDLCLPGIHGLDVLAKLRQQGVRLPVVVVSGNLTVRLTVDCMRAGALTALEKPFQPDALIEAVAEAMTLAEVTIAEESARLTVEDCLALLSPGERAVLDRVIRGAANKVVAAELGVSTRTVENRRAKIMKTFGVSSLAELVQLLATRARAN